MMIIHHKITSQPNWIIALLNTFKPVLSRYFPVWPSITHLSFFRVHFVFIFFSFTKLSLSFPGFYLLDTSCFQYPWISFPSLSHLVSYLLEHMLDFLLSHSATSSSVQHLIFPSSSSKYKARISKWSSQFLTTSK